MRIRPSFTARTVLVWLTVLGAYQLACVGGRIPPSMFQFTNVVPYSGPGEGGWKVAQVLVLLNRISPRFPQNAVCEIEVGVPEVNKHGPVTDELAQAAAAKAAGRGCACRLPGVAANRPALSAVQGAHAAHHDG